MSNVLTPNEILINAIGHFQSVCTEQQQQIDALQEQLHDRPAAIDNLDELEAELERLRQENAVLRMKLEDNL